MLGRGLQHIGVKVGYLDAQAILRQAMKSTGIWGITDDSFQEPLEVFVKSANQQSNITPLGCMLLRKSLVACVSNRLEIDATIASHPDILEQPVDRPIFIVALPRTGTTFLHRLFAQDASLRVPQYWEMLRPCPPPEKETYTTDPRIQNLERERVAHTVIEDLFVPQFKAMHEVGARMPEECMFLLLNDLMCDWLVVTFYLPEYRRWLHRQNLHPLYQRHKKQLQLLQFRYRGERWVLKAPVHLYALESLMQVYPDAYIVQTHRDPASIVASTASLIAPSLSVFYDNVFPEAVGQGILEYLGFWIDRGMAARKQAESNPKSRVRFFDVRYEDLRQNPLSTIRALYTQCSLTWSPSIEQQMTTFIQENPQHKHGKHQYTLSQFGLKESQVRERFAAYYERFLNQ